MPNVNWQFVKRRPLPINSRMSPVQSEMHSIRKGHVKSHISCWPYCCDGGTKYVHSLCVNREKFRWHNYSSYQS